VAPEAAEEVEVAPEDEEEAEVAPERRVTGWKSSQYRSCERGGECLGGASGEASP
jgi:hypothetical protein